MEDPGAVHQRYFQAERKTVDRENNISLAGPPLVLLSAWMRGYTTYLKITEFEITTSIPVYSMLGVPVVRQFFL